MLIGCVKSLINRSSLSIKNHQIKLCNVRFYSDKLAKKVKNHCIVSVVGSECSNKSSLTDAMRMTSAGQYNFKLDDKINSGSNDAVYSRYFVNDTQIIQIDVDSKSNKNLRTSSYGADIGLIVIDCKTGLTNETKEHIIILQFHGIQNYLVHFNKTDDDDQEMKELIIDELKQFFKKRNLNLDDQSILYGSTLKDDQSIVDLLKKIEQISKQLPRDEQMKKPAIFSVKRSHSKENKGTEVSGFMRQGVLKKGDIVNMVGFDRLFKTKIQEIESFKEQLVCVHPGITASLLLKSIKRDDIQRGMIVYHPDNNQFEITDHFRGNLYFFEYDEQVHAIDRLIDDTTLMMFARTFDTRTIIKIENDQKELLPGQSCSALFKLIKTMPLEKDMKFLLAAKSIIAIGEIKEVLPSYEIEFLNKAKRN